MRTRLSRATFLLLLSALLFLPGTGSATARTAPCNGSSELCSRPFNRVVLPGSHNSMSNAEQGWKIPNQTFPIPEQLRRGARAMLIDVYYGRKGPLGVSNVQPRDYDPAAGDRLYLCHVVCGSGATDLVEEFGRVRSFLAANPREVMLFVVEDYVKPDDFATAVQQSGLIDFVYRGPTTEAESWPTLGQMINRRQRVVFLAERDAGAVPWYHKAYDGTLQETRYSWPFDGNPGGIARLTDPGLLPASCVPNRGGTTGPLFLMNHWVSGTPPADSVAPDPAAAAVVNTAGALVARARACEGVRGLMPTLLAVDFFGTGDVVGAARTLNGVRAAPFLRFVRRPAPAAVRAGRRAAFRLRIANIGDAAAGVRLCAAPPGRLAARPPCQSVRIPAGGARNATFRIATRARSRGTGAVRFTVRAPGNSLSASARLRVRAAGRR